MKPSKRPIALIVDDEPDLARDLGRAFEDLGFEVRTAIDYDDAVMHIKAQAPAFLCINLSLPRGSGYDVCDFVRAFPACPGARVLVVSERCSPEDIAFAEEAGANAFLPKPFSMNVFRETVTRMLSQ